MSSYNNKFLEKYKELEILLKNRKINYKEFEDSQNEEVKQKLRICRMMRNYISHNDIFFVESTEYQIDFIKNTIENLQLEGDIVKKHLGRINNYTCSLYDKCSDVLEIMSKRQIINYPVYIESRNGNIYDLKVVSIFDASKSVLDSKTNRIKDISDKLTDDIIFVDPLEDYVSLDHSKIIFCTDNGNKNGKLLGFVKPIE